VVMNTPGGNTISTAEHTFSMMLALLRQIPTAHASMRAGEFDRKIRGVEVCNKTLAIVGMGRIGGEVARRAIGFGMRVIAYDPYLALSRAKSLQVELFDDLEELLPLADVITLHMPMTPETRGILNRERLLKCKKGIFVINCARGGLVLETDLTELIESGHVGGAALDVYEVEPLPQDSPLRRLKNVVLTPHLAASTTEAQESVGVEIAEAIAEFFTQGSIRNAVNVPNVDARTLGVLRPYLALGDKLGSMLSQLAPRRLESLVVHYYGKVRELDTTPVTRSILKGLLRASVGATVVNEVNAPRFAKNHGMSYSETKSSEPCDFTDMIRVEVAAGDEKCSVAAAFFGPRPRIVEVNGFSLEAAPEGILFIMENRDRPGIVGWIGTFLGQKNINIASMSLSRAEPGCRALSILNLDSCPDEATLQELQADPDIHSVRIVRL